MSVVRTGRARPSSDHPVETRGGNAPTFTRVTFPTPFPTGSEAVVPARTQVTDGPGTPGIRIHGVTPEGFLIRFNEIDVNSDVRGGGRHVAGTAGWIATTV